MSTGKNVIVLFTTVSEDVLKSSGAEQLVKMRRKGALVPLSVAADVKTEALNELAVLKDRFGGKIAKAAIVTAEKGGIAMRNRASELGIGVIDINDLTAGRADRRLRALMRDIR